MLNAYSRLFAGTYFYLLKLENRGEMSERGYFAIWAILLLALSETFLIWSVGLIWFGGVLMASGPMNLLTGGSLLAVNYFLFVHRGRYVAILRRYKDENRRLLYVAVAIHAACIGLFFVPVVIKIARMP